MGSERDRPHAPGSPEHLDAMLDEALIQTFPASDPVAIDVGPGPAVSAVAARPAGPPHRGRPARREPGRTAPAKPRLDYAASSPEGIAAFRTFNRYVDGCGLERSLLELVRTRASQINGCAYCLDMHTRNARAAGETEQRLFTLAAWRETPFFSDRERAALAWTEAVTLVSGHAADDALHDELGRHFSEKEIVDLTLAVIAINGWNRLVIPFRVPVGPERPRPGRTRRKAS